MRTNQPIGLALIIFFSPVFIVVSALLVCTLSRFFWDVHTKGETPVPIPNTVVKPFKADGSVVVRLCESR